MASWKKNDNTSKIREPYPEKRPLFSRFRHQTIKPQAIVTNKNKIHTRPEISPAVHPPGSWCAVERSINVLETL